MNKLTEAQERELFKEWHKRHRYADRENAWRGWQARADLQQPAQDHPEQPLEMVVQQDGARKPLSQSAADALDAGLYRSLRSMHWSVGKLVVIKAKDVPLGVQTYSRELLDAAIQAEAEGEKS